MACLFLFTVCGTLPCYAFAHYGNKRGDSGVAPFYPSRGSAVGVRRDIASPDWCRTRRIDRIYRPSLKQLNRTLLHAINAIPEQIIRDRKLKRVKAYHEADIIPLNLTYMISGAEVCSELSPYSLAIDGI
jgi:hypothetical protein